MRFMAMVALAGVFSGAVSAAERPYPELEVDLNLKRAPGGKTFYAVGLSGVPGPENNGHTSNAGFVVTGEGVVVFDALGTPALGWELLQAIRSHTQAPIRYVVVSHYHADHIYGLQAFRDHTGAKIIAHDHAYDYLRSEGAQNRLLQRHGALFPWVDEQTRLIEPDITFGDQYTFELGGNTFRLVYAGAAHAPDDVIMVVEESGVVFSGDVVFLGRLPFIGEGADTGRWLEALERVAALEPRFIIPGHGEALDDADRAIRFTREYLTFLRERMGAAAEQLLSFDEAYRQTDWSRYRGVPTFEATNRGNAHSVFLEMEWKLF